jgi:hypothetical protein
LGIVTHSQETETRLSSNKIAEAATNAVIESGTSTPLIGSRPGGAYDTQHGRKRTNVTGTYRAIKEPIQTRR